MNPIGRGVGALGVAIAVGEVGQVFHLPLLASVVLAVAAGFAYRLDVLADPLGVLFGFLGIAAVFVKFGSALTDADRLSPTKRSVWSSWPWSPSG